MSELAVPGDDVPETGPYTFVDVWGTECGWIHLRKGWTFPTIHPQREYRFFLRRKQQAARVVLREAA